MECRLIAIERTVHLIGGYVMKAVRRAIARKPDASGRLEQGVGAENVRADELIRPADRAIDVALRGKVHDGIHRVGPQTGLHARAVADVRLQEMDIRCLLE